MCEISVIIPVYNVEKHIEKCLKSILKQTFTNYELLIVNDGSTDMSISKVKNILKDFPYRIINKDNAGLPQARKTGFENATGKYIFFVDADDWIEPDTLQVLYELSQSTNADITCCNISIDDSNENCIEKLTAQKNALYTTEEAVKSIHDITGIYTYMWNKLFKKNILKSEHFPIGHFVGEDYCSLFSILLEQPLKIVQSDKVLYHYVQHGGNMTKAGFGESFRLSYMRFHDTEQKILERYPALIKSVSSYLIVQDMAVFNSMMRNSKYDETIMKKIISSIRHNIIHFVLNSHMKVLYRGSAFIIAINWKLYRKVYLWALKKDY